jgi:hypothetical protein
MLLSSHYFVVFCLFFRCKKKKRKKENILWVCGCVSRHIKISPLTTSTRKELFSFFSLFSAQDRRHIKIRNGRPKGWNMNRMYEWDVANTFLVWVASLCCASLHGQVNELEIVTIYNQQNAQPPWMLNQKLLLFILDFAFDLPPTNSIEC